MPLYSERNLIEDIRSHDARKNDKGFSYVYKTCYLSVKNMILTNNGNESDAEDIFQEAVVVFYKKLRDDDFVLTCSPKTFIYSVARNLWLKKLNKSWRYEKSLVDVEECIDIVVEDEEEKVTFEQVTPFFEKLDEVCKKVLLLYYFEKLSMREIMPVINYKSEQAVKNKKGKCMKHLMGLLKEAGLK